MAGKLFLGGISPNTTTEAIESHFMRYGTVVDAVVMYKDGKHRGFGFVTFENPDAAHAVLGEEQVIDGRTIDVKPAVPQNEAPLPAPSRGGAMPALGMGPSVSGGRGPGRPSGGTAGPPCDKVFVGGLAQTTTDDMLRDYFSKYGNLVDVVVMKDRATLRSRGFGFVQYDSTEPVDQIMVDYTSHNLDGKWVEVKRAVPQDRQPPGPQPSMRACGGFGGGYCGGGGGGYVPKGGGKGYAGCCGGGAYTMYGGPAYTGYSMGGYNPYGAYGSFQSPGFGRARPY